MARSPFGASNKPAFVGGRSRGKVILGMFLVLALVTSACGSDPTAGEGAEDASPAEGETSGSPDTTSPDSTEGEQAFEGELAEASYCMIPSLFHIPYMVGIEEGIFLKHGIDLELKMYGSPGEVLTALDVGEVEFCWSVFAHMVQMEAGVEFVGLAGSMADATSPRWDDSFSIWTYEGSGIETVEDLAGKTVGGLVGSTSDQYLDAVLLDHGMSPDDVEKVNSPIPENPTILRNREVDAVAVREPSGVIIEDLADDEFTPVEVLRGGGHIGYSLLLSTRPDYEDANPEVVQRMVTALAEAQQHTRQNMEQAAEVATRWVPGPTADQVLRALERGYMKYDLRVNDNTFSGYQHGMEEILIPEGRLEEVIPPESWIRTEYVDYVLENYPEFFDDLESAS